MAEYNIELISIGDEILLGHTVDSNANWIERQLVNAGFHLRWHSTVGDNEDDMIAAFQLACQRSQVVIVTGGLGPTHDDITRPVLAKFFNDKLETRADLLQIIFQRFEGRGIKPQPGFDVMCEFPTHAEPILNQHGSAPGIHFQEKAVNLFALPGVPEEMKEMISSYVLKVIAEKGQGAFRYHIFRTCGKGESHLSQNIGDSSHYLPVKLAYLPSIDNGVTIRLSHTGAEAGAVERELTEKTDIVRQIIKGYIYAEDDVSLPETICQRMVALKLTLAVAESCTGGMICDRLVEVAGSSAYFDRGFITYSNRAKVDQLGLSREFIDQHGAVSEEAALAMAKGAMEKAGTDIGLSVTGIAGPTGETPDKPIGLTYIALCDQNTSIARRFLFRGSRTDNRRRATLSALTMLWKKIK